MILYGCIANVSIGKLFISGFGVGGLLCITMMILVGLFQKMRYGNRSHKSSPGPGSGTLAGSPALIASDHHYRRHPYRYLHRNGGRSCGDPLRCPFRHHLP
ncbi:MAG: TRAP transporter large permease subunit [Enterocloster sp.]